MNIALPDKLYFKIGEVAQLADVKTSVLRFWESEFDFLKPEKSSTGQRLYTKKEVALILEVKRLLYAEKFTISGVKQRITPRGKLLAEEISPPPRHADPIGLLREIKTDLQALKNQLQQ
ncbi:MerR family transcriptional regulator [Geobacter sp. SVR]|uniref:MerR family transcriptional regulator n=1 Tax=Geobacter sp. SVR TaxID=2495594 RepID=UPI00143EFD24|nr:MerR family transcriptional regulator [Geobacter sp. SVR]BCS54230.1 MerR family transcriptional regulator [Geobacter sp. SVR]GCF85912.1 MerR family transcriptional regulator [Geobacter sp. SVR]